MKLSGDWQELDAQLLAAFPEAEAAIERASDIAAGSTKQRVARSPEYRYQAVAIYGLASAYNRPGARILEIGTYYGFSGAVIAQAASAAEIVTLNPTIWEWEVARKNLQSFKNVTALCIPSWEYLDVYDGPEIAFSFVDGDHKQAPRDLAWWNWIETGGLFLWHDYSPNGSARACPPVWRALHSFSGVVGRDPDVEIIDSHQVGIAGWIKRADDKRIRA